MTTTQAARPETRSAVRLERATIAYNAVEGIIAIAAGAVAGLVSLIGFGIDSAIEVAAAVVVLVRLRAELRGDGIDHMKERRALRFIAITFFALAAYMTSKASRTSSPRKSPTRASSVSRSPQPRSRSCRCWLAGSAKSAS